MRQCGFVIGSVVVVGELLGVLFLGPVLGWQRNFRMAALLSALLMLQLFAARFSVIGRFLLGSSTESELTGDPWWDFVYVTGFYGVIFWLGYLAGTILPLIGLTAAARDAKNKGCDE